LVCRDVETDDEEGREVDDSDTPEGTLDSGRKGLARVGSFSSGDTDELSSGERESGSDEYSADTFESVSERSRITPVSSTNLTEEGGFQSKFENRPNNSKTHVFSVRSRLSSSTVEYNTDDDEDDYSGQLEA